ncbi:L-histidine N(alpha)-methyltransferase [Glaciimonas sp. Gout2]|uniref:L-histidine N(alpha)-methyltransferase n=2 Tax=Glaciimonas TaxID=1229970 RepID=UPI002AB4037A|nr:MULTISPECIES: L-histidine N(alpha)-methyltransferase [unclassified Glaciimonas]MDY7544861.1 L-histidine N(alpha)-methyltransferase [Glaciimonas sp. CA11.2]MEB0014149.1 L-histidine N(alpha)-methyltransferase [Glaciimonas sp. Cout2]MEB0083458.1 L-histidine N(alpha)-methyltransferase [Glaciimonas sp. Gout2]
MAQQQQPEQPENCTPQSYIEDAIVTQLEAGLMAPQASTSPKYLYDTLGSRLFAAICELPEYYPTRTEAIIFDQYASQIATAVGRKATLIDLGAGNCAKAAKLFPSLQPSEYVAVDISEKFLQEAVAGLQQQFPHIAMTCLGMDFSNELELPVSISRERRQFFYPGSSIGNYTPLEALKFLLRIRKTIGIDHSNHSGKDNDDGEHKSGGGGLLIGIDLIKDKAILDAAYDDALGVTASFNLNLLQHINRLLDADFELREWRHRGFYNAQQHRVEMHLEAKRNVTVRWKNGGSRQFVAGERIHTESSYKYTQQSFTALLQQAGFGKIQTWCDPHEWFMVCHAQGG